MKPKLDCRNAAIEAYCIEVMRGSLEDRRRPLDILLEAGFPPHPGPQERWLQSEADIAIFGGQAGGGKSVGLLLDACRHTRNPEYGAVIFRRTSPDITNEGGLWDTSMKFYPSLGAVPLQSPTHHWRFPSGARVSFQHLQHEKDRLRWKSAQVPMIGWDQVEEFSESQFWYLVSRNRTTCGVKPYIRGTCNPVPPDDPVGGWLHTLLGWWIGGDGLPIEERSGVLRWFFRHNNDLHWGASREEAIELAREMGLEKEPKSITFIRSRLEDNITLMEEDPDYQHTLDLLPRTERMRLREGNWLVRDTAGELVDRAWFGEAVDEVSAKAPAVRYWDKGATEGGGTFTAGVKIRGPLNGIWYIEDAVYGQWAALERETTIKQVAESDGKLVTVVVEQEPGGSGKDVAAASIRMLAGWKVYPDLARKDKVERSGPFRAQSEAGNVRLKRGDWNETFLRHSHNFGAPNALIDLFDAAVGGFNWLSSHQQPTLGDIDIAIFDDEELIQAPAWRVY